MDFKYYRWSLRHIIGLALLLGGLATALWLDNRTLAFVLCGLLALAFAALIQLYRHVFESIDLMFKALINEDYTFRLPIRNRLNGYRRHLNEQFNAYSRHVRRLRQAQHEHDVFHQLVMEHIRTGVVVADETGRVLQANPMALPFSSTRIPPNVTLCTFVFVNISAPASLKRYPATFPFSRAPSNPPFIGVPIA